MVMYGVGSSTSVGEFGWTGAMGTYVSIDPSEKVSIVYMFNDCHKVPPPIWLCIYYKT